MLSNPPWADNALKLNWSLIETIARERGLPLPANSGNWKFKELGCGHYGCVISTSDPGIVFKLTSDPTEAEFIKLAEPLGWPDGIVKYHAIAPLPFTFRKRKVFAIWREAAHEVGRLDPGGFAGRKDYDARMRHDFAVNLNRFKDHAARFRDQLKAAKDPVALLKSSKENAEKWAWDTVGVEDASGVDEYGKGASVRRAHGFGRRMYGIIERQTGARKLAASWRACWIVAEQMDSSPESDLVGGAFMFYMENGFLLADVHTGNVGKANREDYKPGQGPWVITDPGHVVVLG